MFGPLQEKTKDFWTHFVGENQQFGLISWALIKKKPKPSGKFWNHFFGPCLKEKQKDIRKILDYSLFGAILVRIEVEIGRPVPELF